MNYNLPSILVLLREAFSVNELEDLIFEIFPGLQPYLKDRDMATLTRELVQHAHRMQQIPLLLEYVENNRSEKYKEYMSHSNIEVSKDSSSYQQTINEVKLSLDKEFRTILLEETKKISQQLAIDIVSQLESKVIDLKNSLQDAENAYRYSASRYGLGYRLLEVKCFINANGSARVERVVHVQAFSELEHLDTYLLVPEDDIEQNIGIEYVRSLTEAKNILLTDKKFHPKINYVSSLLAITPGLRYGDEIIYELSEKISPESFAVGLSEEEISERETPYDYFGWNINRPTRKLIMGVYFPENYVPTSYNHEVRYASASGFPAKQVQFEEQNNLDKGALTSKEDKQFTLELEIEYPMTGLMYMLSWDPRKMQKND